jgi:uncharacterized protein (TIGR02466 family)
MTEIRELFPTAIYVTKLNNIMSSEMNKLMAIYEDKDNWKSNTNGNFASKETYIFDKVLGANSLLISDIQYHINEYSKNILGEQPMLKPTQSWMNFNPPKTSHHKHWHGNSIISGVLYLKTNNLSGAFIAHKREEFSIIKTSSTKNTPYVSVKENIIPTNMMLILFPSMLEHSVSVNQSTEDRISLSFNTFYKNATIGDKNNLFELHL